MARERLYLNQSKLSLLAGLGRVTVYNIEEERTLGNVGVMTVEKLAKILRVSPCWLAFGVGSSALINDSENDIADGHPIPRPSSTRQVSR